LQREKEESHWGASFFRFYPSLSAYFQINADNSILLTSFALIIILFYFIMAKGKVKFFNESKGYGFIVDDDTKKEHFVHISGLVDEVREGESVTFELQDGKKGINAVNVKLA